MSDHFSPDGSFINSIVGEGTSFKGELRVSGLLRIDGDFSGIIETAGKVLVGKNGRAACTIKAETVVIGGVVQGNIQSTEKVVILSTGMLIGNVTTPRLIVEEGVILHGKCLISATPQAVECENQEYSPSKEESESLKTEFSTEHDADNEQYETSEKSDRKEEERIGIPVTIVREVHEDRKNSMYESSETDEAGPKVE